MPTVNTHPVTVLIVSVGLWDVLWHDIDTFSNALDDVRRWFIHRGGERDHATCTQIGSGCRPSGTRGGMWPVTAVVWRALTPVVESKLPPHKQGKMTNARIEAFNARAFQFVKSMQLVTAAKDDSLAANTSFHYYDSYQLYDGKESPDGVHYVPEMVLQDVINTLQFIRDNINLRQR
jgi:hypothetical protein